MNSQLTETALEYIKHQNSKKCSATKLEHLKKAFENNLIEYIDSRITSEMEERERDERGF